MDLVIKERRCLEEGVIWEASERAMNCASHIIQVWLRIGLLEKSPCYENYREAVPGKCYTTWEVFAAYDLIWTSEYYDHPGALSNVTRITPDMRPSSNR
jgi:hypothetical protein